MAKDKDDVQEMKINESADGSAVIDLPDDIKSPDNQQVEPEDTDSGDEEAIRAEIAENGEVDPEQEAIREAKRAKRRSRKDYHKQVATEKDMRLQNLQRQNQDLLERLSVVERKTQGTEIARIQKAIEDQESRILFAKQKIKEATETGNGDLLTSAQEMWFEARRMHESLENMKARSTAPQQQPTIQAPDPSVQRHASAWMSENSWYDPNGRDPDSKIALTIDQAMADEGSYDPKTAEYWEELDNRLQKYLPHRYTDSSNESSNYKPRHKNVVTSSGREFSSGGGSKNTFTLSPEQVRAMKDAGMWDDSDKRAKMIRRYALEAKQLRS